MATAEQSHKQSDLCTIPDGNEEKDILTIIKDQGIIDYTKTIKIATQRGDNFLGLIYAIDVIGHDETNYETIRQLHLILKCSPRSQAFRQYIPVDEIFLREINTYVEYLPELYKLQEMYQISNGLLPAPKLYKYSTCINDEYLIMENKKMEQFVMHSRKTTLDMDHCRLVLEQMGYLHGLSYVLKFRKADTYARIVRLLRMDRNPSNIDKIEMWLKQYKDTVARALNLIDPENEKDVYMKMVKLMDDIRNVFETELGFDTIKEDPYSVVVHGDCWTNNILFKYDNNQKPVELCFLDWQNARASSPAIDLSYFIYTCTGTELRKQHFDDMLQIYYQAVSRIIKQCDLDAEKCLSFSRLEEHVQQHFKFGVIMASLAIPMFISESGEVPEFQKLENFDETSLNRWNVVSINNHLYEERIRGVIFHAASRGFI